MPKIWWCLCLGEEGWLQWSCGRCARWIVSRTCVFVNLAGCFAFSHPYIRPCWVGLNTKHALPRYCRALLITAGKALGGASVTGMHRHILMSDDVFGRKHELHHSGYNPLCTLSPASPSTSLQPGMPRLSAILYGLPKKQIIMHYKMKLAFKI